jgi:hypothetical protein
MDSKSIIPFCIYHYINTDTDTYYSYISYARPVKREDGTFYFDCIVGKDYKWKFYGVFYAVSPLINPYPTGMKLFYATKRDSFPYCTTDVGVQYDPYNTKDHTVYFTTYNQPVLNTVPLYFHKRGEFVFPTFDKKPPNDDSNWNSTDISPVYVMTLASVKKKNIDDVKFKCINGRCIPWTDMPDIYDAKSNATTFEKCLLICNEIIGDNSDNRDLIDKIYSESNEIKLSYGNKTLEYKNKGMIGISFILLFLILISIFIWFR